MVIRKALYVKYFQQGFLAIEGYLLNFSCQTGQLKNPAFFIDFHWHIEQF
jgi:hypothetical protein